MRSRWSSVDSDRFTAAFVGFRRFAGMAVLLTNGRRAGEPFRRRGQRLEIINMFYTENILFDSILSFVVHGSPCLMIATPHLVSSVSLVLCSFTTSQSSPASTIKLSPIPQRLFSSIALCQAWDCFIFSFPFLNDQDFFLLRNLSK